MAVAGERRRRDHERQSDDDGQDDQLSHEDLPHLRHSRSVPSMMYDDERGEDLASPGGSTPVLRNRRASVGAKFAQSRAKSLQGLPIWAARPGSAMNGGAATGRLRVTSRERPPIEPIEPAFRSGTIRRSSSTPSSRPRSISSRRSACASRVPRRSTSSRRPGPSWTGRMRSPSCRRPWCSRPWRGAASLRPRRPRPGLRPRRRRRPHLLHHRRLRHRDRRLRDAGAPPVDQSRPRRRHASSGPLSSIAFWWPTLERRRLRRAAQLHELDAGWNNTVKHLQGMVNGEREARYAVEMAR